MHSTWKLLVVTLALVAVPACGSSPKAGDTAPAGDTAAAADTTEHGATGEHHGAPAADATAELKAPGDAQVGDKTTCPVSGNAFTVTAESSSVEHEGKTYYFCCPGCDAQFKADPQKYLGAK